MPLNRPILDDRSYEQLRDELVRRIPVYTREWTDHNVSDPGITLLELFAFLGENLLYRFNQIPEAAHMEYLRLLQIPLTPAQPARTLLALSTKETTGIKVPLETEAKAGDIVFETRDEVRVLPVSAVAVSKARQAEPDPGSEPEVDTYFKQAMGTVKGVRSASDVAPYRSEVLAEDGSEGPVDFDNAVDGMLWIAVLAEEADDVAAITEALAEHDDAPLLLNIGFVPDIRLSEEEATATTPAFTQLFRCPGEGGPGSGPAVEWQVSTGRFDGAGEPVYRRVRVEGDTSLGLTGEGVIRLQLPDDVDDMGAFAVDDPDRDGTGELPPLVDDDLAERVVFWLRAYRLDKSRFGKVAYVGANATRAVQQRKARAELLGTGTGQPNQTYSLGHRNVLSGTLVLEVEEPDGWWPWDAVDGFYASGESDRHYVLDAEAGQVKFGNGLRGLAPQIGQRIRATRYRYGGGSEGNVAPEAVNKIAVNKVEVSNPLMAYHGADAESVADGLDRIPGELRRRDRAVTRGDFRELAMQTPGASIGRAECLPLFHPNRPKEESAGVVSVVVWPEEDADNPNAPLPDKNQLRTVCRWLDARRLVTTELYVLPPKYRQVAVAVGVEIKEGYGVDAVRHWVELVIRQYLAPLPPYGPEGQGWPLGREVLAAELEAAAVQVEGVEYLHSLELVGWDAAGNKVSDKVSLARDEVPELIEISVEDGPATVKAGEGLTPPADPDKKPGVPVPVLREEC